MSDETQVPDAATVERLLRECLYRDDELPGDGTAPADALLVETVVAKFGLHPHRVAERKTAIRAQLDGLPETFRVDHGGGWSFLNACTDRSGRVWGEHRDIDNLLALGIASGQAKILLPRDMWPMFPGGMPYFAVGDVEAKAHE